MLSKLKFDPDVFIGIVLEAKTITNQESPVRKLAVGKVYLTFFVKMCTITSLHLKVRVGLLTLFFSFLEVRPACILCMDGFNTPLVFDFLILTALKPVKFDEVLSIGMKC